MIASARGTHSRSPENQRGSIPSEVVRVVSKTGRNRLWVAIKMASRRSISGFSASSTSIRSIRTMALLTTIPASAMTPNTPKKLINVPPINHPATTPMMPKGMARTMMADLRKELNWSTSKITMRKKASGRLAKIAPRFSALSSSSPPNS